MKFPVFDPPPAAPLTDEGIALQESLLNQIAPLFAYALTQHHLDDQQRGLGLLLFNRQDPGEQVLVLATMQGDALALTPSRTAPYWEQWRTKGCRFPPVTTPERWGPVLAGSSWFCAWQMVLGGPPCAASLAMEGGAL